MRSTYPLTESWKVLGEALQRTGMTADEAALVMGGKRLDSILPTPIGNDHPSRGR